MFRLPSIRRPLGALVVSWLLGGCAAVYSIAPGTPAADIEARVGKPFRVWQEAGGGASWEYPTGPAGNYTWMARIGADGRLVRVEQVLDWPFFNKLVPGMPMTEVEHLLGRPFSTAYYPNLRRTAWSWRWEESGVFKRCFDAWADPDGKLVTTAARDQETGDHGLVMAIPC